MSRDFNLEAHKSWLGLLQPVGLVVSPVALTQAQAAVDNNCIEAQNALKRLLSIDSDGRLELPPLYYGKLFTDVLDWHADDLKSLPSDSDVGSIFLKEYQETLSASHVVFESKSAAEPLILVQQYADAIDFDSPSEGEGWGASAQSKFERILREKAVSIGLLLNPLGIRLVYAPRGESSGYVTFPHSLMSEVQGRVVLGALKMLLGADRLFTLAQKERLPSLLLESRKYQNTVSTQLSEQVLGALYELLRGLQAASDRTNGALLADVLSVDPNHVYHGLLTVLLRNVFLLYAEDRDLIPAHRIYNENYSIKGLFEKLRADESRYADSMDQRYGAWAQLISVYRIIYEGIKFPGFALPARQGHLFDPKRFPFLEGRTKISDPINPPLISDGVIYRVLRNLMVLDGERISYRTLDVEQIGSVYETVMGFRLQISTGPSIAIKPKKAHGAPVVIDLGKLLVLKKSERSKWIKENADQEISGSAIEEAGTIEEIEAALERKIARVATPTVVSKGALILQPSDERRRSGSHYTPRSLTEPIVRKALEPLLAQLGVDPKPAKILELKICDPAMGSGAFLVEVARQLSEALASAWRIHNETPVIPPDEDDLLFARRMIVQRCIYGVDKNPMAVDLAKMALWLATFAQDHAFTFLDHNLKCGDSLVGLDLNQIARGSWFDEEENSPLFTQKVKEAVNEYTELRQEIYFATEDNDYESLALLNEEAQQRIQRLRAAGDLILSAHFSGKNERERKIAIAQVQPTLLKIFRVDGHFEYVSVLPEEVSSFHWELEFPEVFLRVSKGFDGIIGNPPFAGRATLAGTHPSGYIDWLLALHSETHGNSDLVAHFFRRAFDLLRPGGTCALIATNSISQGDTRTSGLRWICKNGGWIYYAIRRLKWPGQAAVVVSVIAIQKAVKSAKCFLDGAAVEGISAFLVSGETHDNPRSLLQNKYKAFQGCVVVGLGFTFDDTDKSGSANSLQEIERCTRLNPRSSEVIAPFIGGEEVNDHPEQKPHRFVVNWGNILEQDARRLYPELLEIVERKVKPERLKEGKKLSKDQQKRADNWWQFSRTAKDLYAAIQSKEISRVLVNSLVSSHLSLVFLPSNWVFSHRLNVFPDDSYKTFTIIQSRVHEIWARSFSSTLEDRLCYTPTDCFETFPMPAGWTESQAIELAGKEYYEFRAQLMKKSGEGLNKVYNRFHDPNEGSESILRLRELHGNMDRIVLDAYGWQDIKPINEFLLDYDELEDVEDTFSKRKKKPWRYRWQEATRDEVLARLLALNAKVADEETAVLPKVFERKRNS